jgi:hypothetical protein
LEGEEYIGHDLDTQRERPSYHQMEDSINHRLFWDTEINNLDISGNKRFIIDRVLQTRMPNDIKWLLSIYSEKDILNVVKKSKSIDKKPANFWAIHYGIDEDEVLCLNSP